MKKFILLTASVALTAVLGAGCASNQGELGNRNIRQNAVRYDANGNLLNNGNLMNNGKVNTLNNRNSNMLNNGNGNGLNNLNNLNNKRFANDQMNEMNRVNGRRLNSNNIVGSHKNYKIEMSDQIANKLVNKNTIKSAYVMLTDNNAYVAVSFEDHLNKGNTRALSRTNGNYVGKSTADRYSRMNTMSTGEEALTAKVKEDIAREVKRMNPSVEHVYVSANPDFVGRMNGYMNDVKLGHPIQGFVAEFNAMAERLFPARVDTITTNDAHRNRMRGDIYDMNR